MVSPMIIATILFDQEVLKQLKEQMLPLCDDMAQIATAIALLGVLWSLSSKILTSLAQNEPIDYFSFLKPLGIGLCIGLFSTLVIGTVDGIVTPVSTVASNIAKAQIETTQAMQDIVDKRIAEKPLSKEEVLYYMDQTKPAKPFDNDEEKPTAEEQERQMQTLAKSKKASFTTVIMSYVTEILSFLLQWLVEAVSMGLAIISTFFLICLAIFGPLAFAAGCFPAFENSISAWLARYISISLWVPITDMFSAMMSRVQLISLQGQMSSLEEGVGLEGILHILISAVAVYGLLSIPTIAGWIVQSGGTGSYSRNMSSHAGKVGAGAGGYAAGAAGRAVSGSSFKKASEASSASGMIGRSFKK